MRGMRVGVFAAAVSLAAGVFAAGPAVAGTECASVATNAGTTTCQLQLAGTGLFVSGSVVYASPAHPAAISVWVEPAVTDPEVHHVVLLNCQESQENSSSVSCAAESDSPVLQADLPPSAPLRCVLGSTHAPIRVSIFCRSSA